MSYLVLHKVDLEERQARYYAVVWQPTLTGGWVVERTRGRLTSQSRQQKAKLVAEARRAQALAARHLRRRLQHAYPFPFLLRIPMAARKHIIWARSIPRNRMCSITTQYHRQVDAVGLHD